MVLGRAMPHVPRRHVRQRQPLQAVPGVRAGQDSENELYEHEQRSLCTAGMSKRREGVINPLQSAHLRNTMSYLKA